MKNRDMNSDKHLNTGEYKPKRYWEERALTSNGDTYEAVCVFGISTTENLAMEYIQIAALESILLNEIELKGAKVMEFGCGVGRWANFFLDQGASYIGVDISEKMLEMANEREPLADFHLLDSSKLPFSDNEFDLVFSITVLHHNPHIDQQAIIDEMVRVTRPGGMILLMEGIGEKQENTSFNMFPRSVDKWIFEVEKGGRATHVKTKFAQWWILKSATFKILRSIGLSNANAENMKTLNVALVRLGLYVDKYLLRVLPKTFADNAAMLFIKNRKGS